jgi:hypothetical protein
VVKIQVVGTTEHPDGSITYTFDLDQDAVVAMAQIGLMTTIIEAAEKVADGYTHPEGAGDGGAGEDGDPPVHGEFPGF